MAAGKGKRMRSSLPKVLHPICGQPILFHILDRVKELRSDAGEFPYEKLSVAVIVGHGKEEVTEAIKAHPLNDEIEISLVHQAEQKGTGHAVRCAMESKWGKERAAEKAPILVLPGDSPLMTTELLAQMLEPLKKGTALRLLTCRLPDPSGYGRIVRRGNAGDVLRIVEERDASDRENRIQEVGASVYCFDSGFLDTGLRGLKTKNAQGEYYLTDLVALAPKTRRKIEVLEWSNWEDLRGINNPWELAQAHAMLNERILKKHAMNGVRFLDARSVQIEASVKIAEGVEVFPGVMLRGQTVIEKDVILESNCFLTHATVRQRAHLKTGTVVEASEIKARAKLGPYAHLRPGSLVGEEAKIGNFVELKKSTVGEKSSIAHLSYLGDAEVGKRVNIGCGFVTCNFDGRVIEGQRKHKTVIEDDVFLGSDCQSVAPVRIGKGSYVASGSTITENVEPDSLAIARSRQVNKPGYAKKLRQKSQTE